MLVQGNLMLFPVHKVIADSMPPVHIAPLHAERIVLVEQMIPALIVYQPVLIVYPAAARREMKLRPVFFLVNLLLEGYSVILVYLRKTCRLAHIRIQYNKLDLFSLEFFYIKKHPDVGFLLSQLGLELSVSFSVHHDSHTAFSGPVFDGEV